MSSYRPLGAGVLIAALLFISGCVLGTPSRTPGARPTSDFLPATGNPKPGEKVPSSLERRPVSDAPEAAASSPAGRRLVVYSSPLCGCCAEWVDYIRNIGFEVEVIYVADLLSLKERYRIPEDLRSCHTSVMGRYLIEGHMPVEAINRLMAENPKIDGIGLAGMPAGSPGMPGPREGALKIYALSNGAPSPFMTMD